MKRLIETGFAVLLALGLLASATPTRAQDPVIGEVLAILKDRGLVDEAQYTELVAKNQTYEKEQQSLLGRIEWSGDFRGRMETMWFDQDDLGGDRGDRTRSRYRLRLGGKATINDYAKVGFRLASGAGLSRSSNRTLGRGSDFDPDGIFIDRAFLGLTAPSGWGPEGSKLQLVIGKQANPFLWKKGKDYLLWDHDISPEGAAVRFQLDPTDRVGIYANVGYFIARENATAKDPNVLGLQGGVRYDASETVEIGGRATWYSWNSVDPFFVTRGGIFGNVEDTSDLGDTFSTLELAGYVQWNGSEKWPVLLYGHYAQNLDADSAIIGSDQDTAWNVGVEVGDKKEIAKLGFGYMLAEANYWPAQFSDSDMLGGFTNRRGFTVYGSKEVLPRTDLKMTLFVMDDLETELPTFANSVRAAERIQLRTDIEVKF